MALPAVFQRLRLPVIAAPMFLTSGPDLVVEVCRAGFVGTFPALNQRSTAGLTAWLAEIEDRLADSLYGRTYGVNLIVHRSNPRFAADLAEVVQHKVPLVITSLGAVRDVVDAVHSYGGLVFHDVITRRHAEKAAEAGVDGIVAVCAGAGGHAGTLSPFALVAEIRAFFSGAIALAGALSTGADVLAARALGADIAYMGTRFLATRESLVSDDQKRMTAVATTADILYTSAISGVAANFLRPSIVAAGLDPDRLVPHGALDMQTETKAWSAVWSAGHGVAGFTDLPAAADLCERLVEEYRAAATRLVDDPFAKERL